MHKIPIRIHAINFYSSASGLFSDFIGGILLCITKIYTNISTARIIDQYMDFSFTGDKSKEAAGTILQTGDLR